MFLRWWRSTFLVCVVPKWVCLWKGSRSLLWWFVCNLCWLLSGLPSGFWGLDVALGLRVNRYKLFVYLFLPLNSFKFICYFFTGINNRLFRKNNWLFFWCFAVFVLKFLANWNSNLDSHKGFCSSWKSFQKPLLNNSPPSRLRSYILTKTTYWNDKSTGCYSLLWKTLFFWKNLIDSVLD